MFFYLNKLKKKLYNINIILIFSSSFFFNTCNDKTLPKISSKIRATPLKTNIKKKVLNSGNNFYSIRIAGNDYNVELIEQHLYFKDLPKDFDNFKIGIMTDFHAGYFEKKHLNIIKKSFYKNLLKKLKNKHKIINIHKLINKRDHAPVDILLFLGDLVNYHIDEINFDKKKWLKNLSSITKYKLVFSILGNHDYDAYVRGLLSRKPTIHYNKKMKDFQIHKLKWHLLKNSHIFLKKGNSKLKLIGIEHLSKCSSIPNQGDIQKALKNYDGSYELTNKNKMINRYKADFSKNERSSNNCFSIIMAHDPSYSQELWNKHNIPLIFSGHTHGAPWMLDGINGYSFQNLFCKNKYSSGLYKNHCGKKFLYVSKGVGLSGINIFGKKIIFKDRHKKSRKPEVVIVTLHKKK